MSKNGFPLLRRGKFSFLRLSMSLISLFVFFFENQRFEHHNEIGSSWGWKDQQQFNVIQVYLCYLLTHLHILHIILFCLLLWAKSKICLASYHWKKNCLRADSISLEQEKVSHDPETTSKDPSIHFLLFIPGQDIIYLVRSAGLSVIYSIHFNLVPSVRPSVHLFRRSDRETY